MTLSAVHPIGTAGQPWGAAEVAQWRQRQVRQRSHADDVLAPLAHLPPHWQSLTYGEVVGPQGRWPLVALRSQPWQAGQPTVLVTGGVHGYETSGVHGALRWVQQAVPSWLGRVNLVVVPCVSPWAYEHIQRWNAQALDPNRGFRAPAPGLPVAEEAAALTRLVAQARAEGWGDFAAHIDLHETTDTDETEFRPALAARDGQAFVPGTIPDGFYLVDDTENPQPEFQQAIVEAVARLTHIAEPDAAGQIIGSPAVAHGVIRYPLRAWGLCTSLTGARYTTTTEVYPDIPRATPEQCVAAQMAAVDAALAFVLGRTP